MIENNVERFSVYLLEKDVLEYHGYKNKYNDYYEKHKMSKPQYREQLKEERDYWYKKYMSKMKYLEENYRKTNVYTDYHRRLEGREIRLPPIPEHVANHVPNNIPNHVPTAVAVPVNNMVEASAPEYETMYN